MNCNEILSGDDFSKSIWLRLGSDYVDNKNRVQRFTQNSCEILIFENADKQGGAL